MFSTRTRRTLCLLLTRVLTSKGRSPLPSRDKDKSRNDDISYLDKTSPPVSPVLRQEEGDTKLYEGKHFLESIRTRAHIQYRTHGPQYRKDTRYPIRTRASTRRRTHGPQYKKDTLRTYFLCPKGPVKTRAHIQRRTHGPQYKKDTRYPRRTSIQDLAEQEHLVSTSPTVHSGRRIKVRVISMWQNFE